MVRVRELKVWGKLEAAAIYRALELWGKIEPRYYRAALAAWRM